MARGLLESSAWYDSLWARRQAITGLPSLIVWGLADPAFPPAQLERWRSALPRAEVVTLTGVGHFPEEESPDEVVRHVWGFLGGLSTLGADEQVLTTRRRLP